MLQTVVTELFGIRHPVLLGGMGVGTDPALVAAVSEAGGLGGIPPENAALIGASGYPTTIDAASSASPTWCSSSV